MTISEATNKITLTCDGIITEFDFSFKYFNNADILVYLPDAGDLATDSDLQTEGSDYTLASTDKNAGGTVTFMSAPADTKEVFIIRKMELSQTNQFKPNTNFPEQVIENALDKLTMEVQQLDEVDSRCVKVPVNSELSELEIPAPEAGRTLKWNATEDGFENSDYDPDEQVAEAAAYAAEAAASAAIAQAASGDIPLPQASSYLRQNAGATALEYRTAAEVADDIREYIEIDKTIMQIGSCSTASATAAKVVTLADFDIDSGISGQTILVTFSNENTADAPTLNVNGTGAKSIANEAGVVTSATNPFYVPADATVEFWYDGTYWRFKNRIVKKYYTEASWYSVRVCGWKEQGGRLTSGSGGTAVTFPVAFKNTPVVSGGAVWSTGSWFSIESISNTGMTIADKGTANYLSGQYLAWKAEGY